MWQGVNEKELNEPLLDEGEAGVTYNQSFIKALKPANASKSSQPSFLSLPTFINPPHDSLIFVIAFN